MLRYLGFFSSLKSQDSRLIILLLLVGGILAKEFATLAGPVVLLVGMFLLDAKDVCHLFQSLPSGFHCVNVYVSCLASSNDSMKRDREGRVRTYRENIGRTKRRER